MGHDDGASGGDAAQDDGALLRLCLPGGGSAVDPAGFRALYDAYSPRVRAILYRYVGPSDLSDLVQEAFIKIWTALPTFRRDATLRTWVYRVAVNVAKDHLRARRRKWWLLFAPDRAEAQAERDPVDHAARWQDRQELTRAMAQLSPALREVLALYSLQELEMTEIARILDIPEGTVKSRLHKARQALRDEVQEARTVYG